MASVEIRIPQLGEGLQEARIVRFLKQPGEAVAADEPIYEMETDKAVMEIESPQAGLLQAWTAKEDDILPIGAVVGSLQTEVEVEPAGGADMRMSAADIVDEPASMNRAGENASHPNSEATAVMPSAAIRNDRVPPRTRARARELGISEDELTQLASRSAGKLFPEELDAYARTRSGEKALDPGTAPRESDDFVDSDLPSRQRTLNFRLQRSVQAVVPATMEMAMNWGGIEAARARLKARHTDQPERAPTQFLLFAWCVARAAKDHPAFRSALVSDAVLRRYSRLHLGIAVARPDDELLMARVPNADALDFDTFVSTAFTAIDRARSGEDQTSDVIQITLTNMAGAGIRLGIPVVVAPAVGTLFIGAPYDHAFPLAGGGIEFRKMANMVLTFDHRVANGIGAAKFMDDIRLHVEAIVASACT